MQLKVTKLGLEIRPDNETDEVYIEQFLGLRQDRDSIQLVRRNAVGLSCLAVLEAYPRSYRDEDPA